MAFGTELPFYDGGRFYNPVASSPDYEMSIINIMDFLIWDGEKLTLDPVEPIEKLREDVLVSDLMLEDRD